ncbi:YceG family protein [Desulfosporosinus sp. BICA1-9]|uniref:YceG family protein n=1 Tax=Desulfosporosinus sp. BICA1-9 TaxID=1531958 RepID=UPI000A5BF3D1|nr:YceG family protein [Desulfosporosinus sp. BICA1-9]
MRRTESKEKLTIVKESDDIFKDILSPLKERGAIPYVYFYRIIGCDDERQYQLEVIRLDERLRSMGNYYCFDKTIPLTTDRSLIERAKKLFEPLPLKDYSNGALLNVLETQGYFSLTSDNQVHLKIKKAFGHMLNLFITNEGPVNLSIMLNFSTKILLWFGNYGKLINKKSLYNPKIVYWGSPTKHETYFLILMSLVGFDVLVLNTSFKDLFETIDYKNEYCLLMRKSKDLPIGAFPSKKSLEKPKTIMPTPRQEKIKGDTQIQHKNPLDSLSNDPIIVVKLKKTASILEDSLVPLNQRSGFVGEPYPIVPAYFVRYIGVPSTTDDWQAEYYNSLYNLDKGLQKFQYLKFLESIPAPTAEESALIPQRLFNDSAQDWQEVVDKILQAKILPQTYGELLNNTILNSFVDIVKLFVEKNSNVNSSIVLNFSLKIVSWLNRYLPSLFTQGKRSNPFRVEGSNLHNPKILFYGPIKAHEIFLLSAFHRIGCDVLFIHSEPSGDKPFQRFDQGDVLTYPIKNNHNLSFAAFPEHEQLIRKSTVAYNASKEIEEVIYGEEVGLFKPWQFENYQTQPITLKTTYDELKILWREPTKLRPEFKIQNRKVYVPNIFAKINGVSEDINDYWQGLKALAEAPNTKIIQDVPFTKISYTKQELYQANYLLNKDGFLDVSKVLKDRHYKLSYLKEPLQHFLMVKINELISSGMFLTTVDEKFKLTIIMTILTMDESFIKLIQGFDYPQEIPKVILYDHVKESFNENDCILLAYFNLIGLDVVIFTPTSYRNIEQHIKPTLLDVHQLPLVKYDLALPPLSSISAPSTPKPGLLSRFFNLR